MTTQLTKVFAYGAVVVLSSGCVTLSSGMHQVMGSADPFDLQYAPITISSVSSTEIALAKGLDVLRKEGYVVTPIPAFYGAVTEAKNIGFQAWKANNEKWNLSYQISFQVIEGYDGQLYWKLSYFFSGSRSGQEDRRFQPHDFDVTEKIIAGLSRKFALLFSAVAQQIAPADRLVFASLRQDGG